ncbi:hypothetical protein [Yinghuangia sp. YIM S09857]|uniref:hypothetical protein n=1 Tax=Yinghuangia sp. YIM S09857 TaxID=3436929 RepID=UPI003F539A7B
MPGVHCILSLADGAFAYPDGTTAGRAIPQAPGAIGALRRALARRPNDARLDVVVYDTSGRPMITVVKHASTRTRVEVQAPGGGPVGTFEKTKGMVRKTYQAKDARGHVIGEVRDQKPTQAEPHYWALLHAPDGTPIGRITQRMQTRPGAVLAGLARNHRIWWELDLGPEVAEPFRTLAVGFTTVIGAVTGLDVRPPGVGDAAGQILPG